MSTKQLTITLSRTSVQIAEVLRSMEETTHLASYVFTSSLPADYKSQLAKFIEELDWISEYEEVTLAWCTQTAFLVPMRLFQETDKKELMHLVVGTNVEEQNLDYNRLPEMEVVMLYDIPLWVKSFFIPRFPRILVQHESSMILREFAQRSTFQLSIRICCADEYFSVLIMDKNELVFCNSFEYQSSEDIVYYFLNVLQQLNLKDEKGKIETYFSNERSKEIVLSATETMQELKALPHFLFSDTPINTNVIQLKCV